MESVFFITVEAINFGSCQIEKTYRVRDIFQVHIHILSDLCACASVLAYGKVRTCTKVEAIN